MLHHLGCSGRTDNLGQIGIYNKFKPNLEYVVETLSKIKENTQ